MEEEEEELIQSKRSEQNRRSVPRAIMLIKYLDGAMCLTTYLCFGVS
jgi:hypothetical protein